MDRLVPLMLVAMLAPPAWGQVYEVHTTSDLTLQLRSPVPKPRVLFWSKSERWEPVTYDARQGAVRFTLSVDTLANGKTTLLVGVPDGVAIDDRHSPAISVSLDGRTLAQGEKPTVLERMPTRLVCLVKDAANRVDAQRVRICVDDRHVPSTVTAATAAGKSVTFEAKLPAIDFGSHSLTVVAQDVSPFRNKAELGAVFTYLNTADLAQASLGATVKVDSCYPNYTAGPLIDGDWQACATSGSPQASWASAETAEDHWAVIELPKPQQVASVSVFWVRKQPSQKIEVQVRKGGQWVTVGSAQPQQACTATTIRIPKQVVSAVRVFQPKGAGLTDRPNLVWVGEIAVNRP